MNRKPSKQEKLPRPLHMENVRREEERKSARQENRLLKRLALMTGALACVLVLACPSWAQPPPVPLLPQSVLERMAARSVGAQNPYNTIVDVRVTNTVTTIYEVSFEKKIRVFSPETNGGMFTTRTNFAPLLGTNIISCVTNTSPVKLE